MTAVALSLDDISTTTRPTVIYSRLLGDLRVSEESLMTFTHGILGFPLYQRFALLKASDDMYWLQSVDDRTLALLLVDPFVHFPQFELDLATDTTLALEITDSSAVLVLAVATLTGVETATANLRGPMVFNLASRKAMQVVTSAPAEIRAPLVLRNIAR